MFPLSKFSTSLASGGKRLLEVMGEVRSHMKARKANHVHLPQEMEGSCDITWGYVNEHVHRSHSPGRVTSLITDFWCFP